MGTRDKLIARFNKQPKDFTFDEMTRLLNGFGYELSNKGKTSGSRHRFINKEIKSVIDLHKPHPSVIMKEVVMRDIYNKLVACGFIGTKK